MYGTFKNVKLSDTEYQKLQDTFPDYQIRIDKLSEYMASKGKRYSSHYATILSWSRKEKEPKDKSSNKGNFEQRDYAKSDYDLMIEDVSKEFEK